MPSVGITSFSTFSPAAAVAPHWLLECDGAEPAAAGVPLAHDKHRHHSTARSPVQEVYNLMHHIIQGNMPGFSVDPTVHGHPKEEAFSVDFLWHRGPWRLDVFGKKKKKKCRSFPLTSVPVLCFFCAVFLGWPGTLLLDRSAVKF